MDVCGVKVTRAVFLAGSMMLKAKSTIMNERIWINRAASGLYFCLHIRTQALCCTLSASLPRFLPARCHRWNAVTLAPPVDVVSKFPRKWFQLRRKWSTRCSLLLGSASIQVPARTLTMKMLWLVLLNEVRLPGAHAPNCSVTDCGESFIEESSRR